MTPTKRVSLTDTPTVTADAVDYNSDKFITDVINETTKKHQKTMKMLEAMKQQAQEEGGSERVEELEAMKQQATELYQEKMKQYQEAKEDPKAMERLKLLKAEYERITQQETVQSHKVIIQQAGVEVLHRANQEAQELLHRKL